MVTIFLHFHNNRNFKEVSVETTTTIGGLIKQFAPKDAAALDFEEDLEVYIENNDEELSKDCTLKDVKLKNGAHLHFSRCKKIAASVDFNGNTFQEKCSPGTTIGVVRAKALKHFKISDVDGAELSLFLDSNHDEPIPVNYHIGSLTDYPVCSVTLHLAKKKNILG